MWRAINNDSYSFRLKKNKKRGASFNTNVFGAFV